MSMPKSTRLFLATTMLAAVLVPAMAHAQDQRLRVSFGGAATAGALDGQPAIAASVGYRFAQRLSFDVDFTLADGAAGRFADMPFFGQRVSQAGSVRLGSMPRDGRGGMDSRMASAIGLAGRQPVDALFQPGDGRLEREGSTALATVGLRYEFPSQIGRFLPYVSGGMGISRTESSFSGSRDFGIPAGPGMNFPSRPVVEIDENVSHVGLAASAGVGASVRIFKQLSADVDARYFRLDRGRNVGRFGGGVSYRF